jgi:hypothetical protein
MLTSVFSDLFGELTFLFTIWCVADYFFSVAFNVSAFKNVRAIQSIG